MIAPLSLPPLRPLLIAALILLATTLLALLGFDRPLAAWLQAHGGALVAPARAATDLLTAAVGSRLPKWVHPLAILALGLALGLRPSLARWRPLFYLTASCLLATRLTVATLKPVFARVRPFEALADPRLGDFFVAGHDSFPSGHTAAYMGLLLPPALLLPRWRWFLLGFAALGSIARVVEGDHYAGDIMASSLVALLYVLLLSRLLGIGHRKPSTL